jgi:dTDP-glucose 4,6-dehydratase
MRILITGGAGFIGSAVIRYLMKKTDYTLLNIDNLSYAANHDAMTWYPGNLRYAFKKIDVCDSEKITRTINEFRPTAIMHLAAESHVDRSIESAMPFVQSNVVGTVTLLNAVLNYWRGLNNFEKSTFRFHHISTDEVYGSLGDEGLFHETTSYDPRSPYSASKAASDHFVSAFYHTHDLPVVITNCSNNYGSYQFPEKLIPLTITKCIREESIPVYGTGMNVRDWLFVDDHAKGLVEAMLKGRIGEKYNIGGDSERTNIDVVHGICSAMDILKPRSSGAYANLITYVQDRPGHDKRYAINHDKITTELGWTPSVTFEEGLRLTVEWYLNNQDWLFNIIDNRYSASRLGVS